MITDQCLCLLTARPGFESRPGAYSQCGMRGGKSDYNTVQICNIIKPFHSVGCKERKENLFNTGSSRYCPSCYKLLLFYFSFKN